MGLYLSRFFQDSSESSISDSSDSIFTRERVKLSRTVKQRLLDRKDKDIEVCLISSIPFSEIKKYDLKSKGLFLYSDMTHGKNHGCFVIGKASDILEACNSIEWIKEVQLIPGVISA